MGLWNKLFKNDTPPTEERDGGIEDLLLAAGVLGGQISKQEALNIPTLTACVDLISDIVASMPIKLYKETNGKVEEIADNRVILLNDETKDTLDGYQFKKALVTDFLLDGAGYAYINRKRNNVESLHYVEANNVSVLMGVDAIYKNYDIYVNGKEYRDFEFLKIVRKSKNGVTGSGVIAENNKILSVIYNTLIFEERLVRTGGNKKGFLKSQNKLSDDAIRSLKTSWANLYSNGTENIVVLNNGIDFAEASATSVEMQLNENKLTNSGSICSIFKMPSGILSGQASEQANDLFIKNCILPILKAFETAINKDLLLPSEKEQSFYFAFDTTELIKGDIEKRFKAYEIAVKNGFMQVDEVRYREDLEPLGLDFIKLGLQDVLYNPKTKEIYTPNTNKTGSMDNPSAATPSIVEGNEDSGGGENE